MPEKLGQSQLEAALIHLQNWTLENGELTQSITFPDFVQAIEFVNKVATLAEEAGHHPDIDIRYNRVRLALVTHDAGGITAKDTQLASSINQARM